jgi:dipeptidyl-peptidase-4
MVTALPRFASIAFSAALIAQAHAQPVAPAATRPALSNVEFLDQFAATNRFRLAQPAAITITPDASSVLFLRAESGRSFKQDLWRFDIATRQESRLLSADQLLAGEEEQLTPEELARRERMRMSSRGISSYQLSDDARRLLIPLGTRLFVVDFASALAGAPKVAELTSEVGAPIDPQLSPDGELLATVRGGEIYAYHIDSATETQLTRGAGGAITHGEAEFVAQEEMGRRHGFWWSPDSTQIAFQRTDTSRVETFTIADAFDPAKPAQSWPYPRAGTANADVSLWIVPVPRRTSVADPAEYRPPLPVQVDWAAYPYLAKVVWEKHGPLTILVQNRLQTEQVLYAVDDRTGAVRELLKEEDETWINIQDDVPTYLNDGSFLWASERFGGDGWSISRVEPASGKRSIVWTGEGPSWTDHLGTIDAVVESSNALVATVYRNSIEQSTIITPLQFAQGAVHARGNVHSSIRGVAAVRGQHSIEVSKDGSVSVLFGASTTGEATWRVLRGQLRTTEVAEDRLPLEVAGELRSTAEAPPFMPAPEWTTADGFHAAIIRPRDFDPAKKYPVLNFAYTGPGVNTVQANGRAYLLHQWFADQGFIVVTIDGRGTPRRGRAWERAIKSDLITVPLQDQCDALLALCEAFPEMDRDRIGVNGWSYGGYFAAMAAMRRPDVFKAGVAGAPVADWRDYDTHYTERYLGMPLPADQKTDGVPGNQAGYDASNVLTYCKDLSVPLLLIHGTADDNVYFTHSIKIADALTRANKPYEFMPLAGQTHMVTQPALVKAINTRIAEFFITHLGRPTPR